MEIKKFKVNKETLFKVLKQRGVALATALSLTVTPIALSTINVKDVEASSNSIYYDNTSIMDYFAGIQNSNVETYLNSSLSSTNLKKVLGYYETLYSFIKNGTNTLNTYYNDLQNYEQSYLNSLLNRWGNEIYSTYKNTSYFNSTCRSVLGFDLNYMSTETGYDVDHTTTMKHYTETLRNSIDNSLVNNCSQTTLKNILKYYKNYINFIKGTVRNNGYKFNELTLTEQKDIYNLALNFTYEIMEKYNGYSYYASSCISTVGWTVNPNNFTSELAEYVNTNTNTNTDTVYPDYYGNYNNYYNDNYYNDNYDNNYYNDSYYNDSYYNDPYYQDPYYNQPNWNYNNGIDPNESAKWHSMYADPSIDTRTYSEPDYIPEYVDENNSYNNYNEWYDYNNTNSQYNLDGYTEDYVPGYIYK